MTEPKGSMTCTRVTVRDTGKKNSYKQEVTDRSAISVEYSSCERPEEIEEENLERADQGYGRRRRRWQQRRLIVALERPL